MKRFCARCGIEIGVFEALNLGNLCSDCYAKMHEVTIPLREISLTLCRKCYSIKFRNRWLPLDLSSEEKSVESITQAIKGEVEKLCNFKVSVNLTPQEVYRIISGEQVTATITFDEKIRPLSKLKERSLSLGVKPHFSLCSTCLKVAGKKFEAIVQLRGFSNKELEQIKALTNKLIVERSGGSHNIQTGAMWEEVDGGVDIMLPSIDVARRIANLIKKTFNVQVKESYKDLGWDRRRGRHTRKLTILLRSRNA